MEDDPTCTDPDKYTCVFENDRVRVVEFRDTPGAKTQPHRHPDSIMYALSSYQRRLHLDDGTRDVAIEAGAVSWLPAQTHTGENVGTTDSHTLFVEIKN